MLELFPEGFEEREAEGTVELAAYTERPEAAGLLEGLGRVRAGKVAAGWEDAWREFHRPVRVGKLWVGPSWEAPEPDALVIVVDPGRAFGTGAHPTTRLCLELLLELHPTSLVDVGCGSGVIAVAAAKLGFAPVMALDNDPAAVEVAAANAAANGVDVDVRLSDILTEPLPPADVAVANIALRPVEIAAARFPGRVLIAAGYLESERPGPSGWKVVERRTVEAWAADVLVRDAG